MTDLETESLYTCFVCGEIMTKDEELLVCPCCGHSIEADDYYNEGDAYKQCPEIDEPDDDFWVLYGGLPQSFICKSSDEDDEEPFYGVDRITTGW